MFDLDEQDKQGEFFSDLPKESKKAFKKRFNLGQIAMSLSYENLILLTIGVIMTLLVCYSLGVEKGRHLVKLQDEQIKKVQEEEKEEEVQVAPTKKSAEPKKKKMTIKVAQGLGSPKKLPYIQVASFRTDKFATQEMQQLKNKGYQPFTLSWGKYKVVCVGGYKNKDEADKALTRLKKLYADCILRNK